MSTPKAKTGLTLQLYTLWAYILGLNSQRMNCPHCAYSGSISMITASWDLTGTQATHTKGSLRSSETHHEGNDNWWWKSQGNRSEMEFLGGPHFGTKIWLHSTTCRHAESLRPNTIKMEHSLLQKIGCWKSYWTHSHLKHTPWHGLAYHRQEPPLPTSGTNPSHQKVCISPRPTASTREQGYQNKRN